ncbi:xylulokinase [Nocardia sp. NPDC055049]
MAHPRIVIGVDSSTQATKVLAVDIDTGRILGTGRAAHTVSTGAARESDPDHWWDAYCEAVVATGHADRAHAVAVAAQQHGLVTLDSAGKSVRPALLWNDVRSAPQARAMIGRFGAEWLAARIGSVPTASFTATKWAWLRANEPRNADRTVAVRLPHDYLTERITGAAVTDRGDASGTGWWNADGYDREILDHIALDPAALPTVLRPHAHAGVTRSGGPTPAGIPVAAGTGDNMAAALGLGLEPGVPVLSLGTSGTAYTVARTRPNDPTGVVAGFADATDRWLPLACTLNCTRAVDHVAGLLGRSREDVESGGSVTVLPYFDGERTPDLPTATGSVHGLRHDTTAGQLLQATYDGAVFSLLTALDRVLACDGATVTTSLPLLVIGGGAQGTAWQNTVRRLSGRPLILPATAEVVAMGAAAQAASLLTGERADAVARRWHTRHGTTLDPLPRDTATVERLAATLRASGALLAPDRYQVHSATGKMSE